MKIGAFVPNIFGDEWRFVDEDAFNVGEAIRKYDKDARLVYNQEYDHFGLARYVREEWLPEGCWYICFRFQDPETGELWQRTPDMRMMEQMSRADMQKQDPVKWRNNIQRLMDLREYRRRQAELDHWGDRAERFVYEHKREKGIKDKAFVQKDV